MAGISLKSVLAGDLQKIIFELFKELAVETTMEEVARYIPILGSAVAAGLSFGTTVLVLKRILNSMREAALKILDLVIESSKQDVD